MESFAFSCHLGKYLVKISLGNFCFKNQNKRVFGYCSDRQNCTSGFCYLEVEDRGDCLVFKNDIFGGYRLYYWEAKEVIYVTDDIFNFLKVEDCSKFEENEYEEKFYRRHGYTSGDSTFYKNIKKMPPAGMLEISATGYKVTTVCDFARIPRTPDERQLRIAVESCVERGLLPLKNNGKKNILCYSGGVDSSYIAQKLVALEIDFEVVYFWDRKIGTMERSMRVAREKAKKLGKELLVIDITDKQEENIEEAIRRKMFFDRHYSKIHFYGVAELVKKWGADIVMINGQNSDAILSFGPSETKLTSYLKRYLLYGNSHFVKSLLAKIISATFKINLVYPPHTVEKLISFYDNFKYCLLYDGRDKEYTGYLKEKILSFQEKFNFSDLNNFYMYLKLFSYVQGSDNQIVIQSAKHWGVQLVMPFTNSDLVKATLKYKDDRKELHKPKYVLK